MSSECFVRYAVSKRLELCACLAMRKLVGTGFYLSLHVMYACNDVMYACNDVMYCMFLCCARFSLPCSVHGALPSPTSDVICPSLEDPTLACPLFVIGSGCSSRTELIGQVRQFMNMLSVSAVCV